MLMKSVIDVCSAFLSIKYLKAYKQLTNTPTYSVFACRREFPNAFTQWNEEDDLELTQLWGQLYSIADLSTHFRRKPGAIKSRIKKLKLEEKTNSSNQE